MPRKVITGFVPARVSRRSAGLQPETDAQRNARLNLVANQTAARRAMLTAAAAAVIPPPVPILPAPAPVVAIPPAAIPPAALPPVVLPPAPVAAPSASAPAIPQQDAGEVAADVARIEARTRAEHDQAVADSDQDMRQIYAYLAANGAVNDRLTNFDIMARRAMHYARKGFFTVVPNLSGSPTVAEAIADITAAVRAIAVRYTKSEWIEQIGFLRSDYGAAAADELTLEYLTWRNNLATMPWPTKPRREKSLISWRYAAARMEARNALANTRRRFDALQVKARTLEPLGYFVSLPRWPPPRTCESFCEQLFWNLSNERLEQERTALEEAGDWDWDAAIEAGDREEEDEHRMWAYFWDGGELYGPSEDPPPDVKFTNETSRLAKATTLGLNADIITPHGGVWRWKAMMANGDYGQINIWECVDRNERIIDRTVTKETWVGNVPGKWHWRSLWYDPRENRRPYEAHVQMTLSDRPGSEHIVHCRAYGLYEHLTMYRLYMEYCEHGDLESLINDFLGLPAGQRRISSRQMWAYFEALASAICIMQRGNTPGSKISIDHTPFIHRDLKPHNVFIAGSDLDVGLWPGLPILKLGDFELAIAASDERSGVHGPGTPGYQAPEQCFYSRKSPHYQNPPVTTASDIWTLGRIMLSLMNLQNKDIVQLFDFNTKEPQETFFPGVAAYYGEELCGLVMKCLKRDPAERPTIQQLWASVQKAVNRGPNAWNTREEEEDEWVVQNVELKYVGLASM